MSTQYTPRPYWETSSSVYDLILLRLFIKKHLLIFSSACVFLFCVSAYYYQKHTEYVSRITFLVNSSNLAETLWTNATDGQIELVNDDRGFNRINQIIFSSQMIDYLIEKFSLYKHYGIDKESENGYLIVSSKLKENLKVAISKTRIITVQVSDRLDYNVASNMANAIGKKINDINRQITLESLTRKTEIFESLSKDLRVSSKREFSQMDSLISNMKKSLTSSVKDQSYRELLLLHIKSLEDKSEVYFKDLFESYKYRLYSMYSLQEKNLPTISVLEKALPNKYSKFRYSYVIFPLLLVFSILVPLFVAYLLTKSKPVISYIFRNRL